MRLARAILLIVGLGWVGGCDSGPTAPIDPQVKTPIPVVVKPGPPTPTPVAKPCRGSDGHDCDS